MCIVHRTFYILHCKLYLVSFTPQNGCAILRGPRSPFRWCISCLRHVLVIAPLLRRQSIIERILTSVQIVNSTSYILHPTFYILHPTFYIVNCISFLSPRSFTPQNGCAILRGPRSFTPQNGCAILRGPRSPARSRYCASPEASINH